MNGGREAERVPRRFKIYLPVKENKFFRKLLDKLKDTPEGKVQPQLKVHVFPDSIVLGYTGLEKLSLSMNRMIAAAILLTFAVVYAFQPDDQLSEMEKRKSAYMRFGRSDPQLADQLMMDKRKSAYMRFGKRSEAIDEDTMDMEKRKSAYMRFGKRKSAYMRFGKRSSEFDDAPDAIDMEKRKSAYMRFVFKFTDDDPPLLPHSEHRNMNRGSFFRVPSTMIYSKRQDNIPKKRTSIAAQ
ncbi:hypothetical protein TELCIR_02863 [Teladorsagia circumcincta]|uniref:Uncharacterized protein n=2 Tax=Teladorsagia circumcincta TaxID=45464 RepID=A0A2G9V017_TELCI|nr:hypothetical protein TELCIR_02863 [Teladorsagia circumcincta]